MFEAVRLQRGGKDLDRDDSGKGWTEIFRLHGLLEPFFEKT
jgi:hypothetical protein